MWIGRPSEGFSNKAESLRTYSAQELVEAYAIMMPLKLKSSSKHGRGQWIWCWLLCEGPSEYFILHRFAEMIGRPLDALGVTVIDYQNNGSPGSFASLARAFGFPWFMTCDNDEGGRGHIENVRNRGFAEDEMNERVWQLPQGDLE